MILHVTTTGAWNAARDRNQAYTDPSLTSEGFIHCSTEAQLAATIATHFPTASAADHVVLVIDPARLAAPVRWEPSPHRGEEAFPHVYGPLDLDAVVDVRPFPSTGSPR